jgi:hypothetical protein
VVTLAMVGLLNSLRPVTAERQNVVTHVSGIDDFEDVGVSLFSAFNMLVLGVFQIDTVRCLTASWSYSDFS